MLILHAVLAKRMHAAAAGALREPKSQGAHMRKQTVEGLNRLGEQLGEGGSVNAS